MTGAAAPTSPPGPRAAAADAGELAVEGLTVRFGAVTALDGVTASFPHRGRIGVIGPNGAGKSTLLNVISGFRASSAGAIRIGERDITATTTRERVRMGIVRSFQTVRLLDDESVFVNVLLGRQRFESAALPAQLLSLPGHRRAERAGDGVVESLLEHLGLLDQRRRPVHELPFGARRLVEVARVLAAEPAVILLDEPGAGLDEGSRETLVELLAETHDSYPSTLVVVEHDIDMIRRLCEHAIVLDHGALIATGTPNEVLASPAVMKAYVGGTGAGA